jgi:hypothetical protein
MPSAMLPPVIINQTKYEVHEHDAFDTQQFTTGFVNSRSGSLSLISKNDAFDKYKMILLALLRGTNFQHSNVSRLLYHFNLHRITLEYFYDHQKSHNST